MPQITDAQTFSRECVRKKYKGCCLELHPDPIPDSLCQASPLERLTATICLTLTVLLGNAGVS